MPTLLEFTPETWAIIAALCKKFSCVTMTPRGFSVEPEVYWMTASASGLRDAKSLDAGDHVSPSVRINLWRPSHSSDGPTEDIFKKAASLVSVAFTSASAYIPSSRGNALVTRGGFSGTAVPP